MTLTTREGMKIVRKVARGDFNPGEIPANSPVILTNSPSIFALGDSAAGMRPTLTELLRMGRYAIPSRRLAFSILAYTLMASLLAQVPALLVREIIDGALANGDLAALTGLCMGIVAVAIAGGLIGVRRNYLVSVTTQNSMYELRLLLHRKILAQGLRFFISVNSGEPVSRLHNDVRGLEFVLSRMLITLVSNSLLILCTIAVIFTMDWVLALVAVAILPLFVLPTARIGRVSRELAARMQSRLAALTTATQETLSIGGYLVVRLLGALNSAQRLFESKAAAVRDLQVQQSIAGRWLLMWIGLFSSIGPAIIFLVGGYQMLSGKMTLGTIVAFVTYLSLLYGPTSALANVHIEVMKACALFRRIFEVIDLPSDLREPADPVRLNQPAGELTFQSVSNDYGSGVGGLTDVSFTAKPGQMIAIIGPSGAGKTTIAYLTARLFDPNAGAVSLDGVDLRQLSLQDLATWIAMVPQETTFFNASIMENLRFAKPDLSEAEAEAACRTAQIHGLISALPQGYDTIMGERGYNLSGGEKQRLAIARALLRDPRVLILDEATSALDTQLEASLQSALRPVLKGRTSLVIAHRLSSVIDADLILVLENGRIVEQGRHGDLLSRNGLYSRLYQNQPNDPRDAGAAAAALS
jgi:ATP-binding cassette subfamily B protein